MDRDLSYSDLMAVHADLAATVADIHALHSSAAVDAHDHLAATRAQADTTERPDDDRRRTH